MQNFFSFSYVIYFLIQGNIIKIMVHNVLLLLQPLSFKDFQNYAIVKKISWDQNSILIREF